MQPILRFLISYFDPGCSYLEQLLPMVCKLQQGSPQNYGRGFPPIVYAYKLVFVCWQSHFTLFWQTFNCIIFRAENNYFTITNGSSSIL